MPWFHFAELICPQNYNGADHRRSSPSLQFTIVLLVIVTLTAVSLAYCDMNASRIIFYTVYVVD